LPAPHPSVRPPRPVGPLRADGSWPITAPPGRVLSGHSKSPLIPFHVGLLPAPSRAAPTSSSGLAFSTPLSYPPGRLRRGLRLDFAVLSSPTHGRGLATAICYFFAEFRGGACRWTLYGVAPASGVALRNTAAPPLLHAALRPRRSNSTALVLPVQDLLPSRPRFVGAGRVLLQRLRCRIRASRGRRPDDLAYSGADLPFTPLTQVPMTAVGRVRRNPPANVC